MKNMVLLAKVQSAIDVDPVPTPALNAILARGMMPQVLKADFVERMNIRGYKGNFGKLAVGVHREFEVEVEYASSGAAGTAPKWAPLLLACGNSETLLASTTATYAPVSGGEPYITLYCYLDGLFFKMLNCKGTATYDLTSKGIPVMKFKFMGDYVAVTDTTFPTGIVFTGFQKPLTVGKVNTPTCTLFGYAGVVQSLTFDDANTLTYRDLINFRGAYSPDRKPTGNVTMELPSVAQLDLGELTRLGTEGVLQVIHGTVAGNIMEMNMPKIQITSEPTITNDNEIAMVQFGFSINPNTGNDERILVAR